MDKKNHRFLKVNYKMYTTKDGVTKLVEKTDGFKPLTFYSGIGMVLEGFENGILNHASDGSFDFTLSPSEAYGEYDAEGVMALDKQQFLRDGVLDSTFIHVDAYIPLNDADGKMIFGRVTKITDTDVVVDLNHPLAGFTVSFKGTVDTDRDATDDEIQQFLDQQQAHHCGHCGGGCHGGDDDGHCGCHSGCHSGEGGDGCGCHGDCHSGDGGDGCGCHDGGCCNKD
ncbi:FKBP-type peptidyl-prolyl cis-trans isomerase [uncultured Prevotella sp.]|uniref:FKBP-type peptidyl-prolyl cis-trans isomerase n=1 Tax=uncultured Prevotella sp. TaxID=159272 RepID=UPI002593ED5B|nr:FKBP-type peptidyl-prolyl cis-trans isomerase [uncultured Prevotella sp.]